MLGHSPNSSGPLADTPRDRLAPKPAEPVAAADPAAAPSDAPPAPRQGGHDGAPAADGAGGGEGG